jgi:hypothetical protein
MQLVPPPDGAQFCTDVYQLGYKCGCEWDLAAVGVMFGVHIDMDLINVEMDAAWLLSCEHNDREGM